MSCMQVVVYVYVGFHFGYLLCTNVSDLRHLESILCGIFDEMSVWQLQRQGDEAAGRRLEEQPCRGRRGAAGSIKELLSRGRHEVHHHRWHRRYCILHDIGSLSGYSRVKMYFMIRFPQCGQKLFDQLAHSHESGRSQRGAGFHEGCRPCQKNMIYTYIHTPLMLRNNTIWYQYYLCIPVPACILIFTTYSFINIYISYIPSSGSLHTYDEEINVRV